MKILYLCLFILTMTSCTQPGIDISAQEYGDEWPFTVISGRLECKSDAVIFHANGKKYAVNGTAKSHGYKPINEIWKDDEKMVKILKESFPNDKIRSIPKISIGPIINKGLSLCK